MLLCLNKINLFPMLLCLKNRNLSFMSFCLLKISVPYVTLSKNKSVPYVTLSGAQYVTERVTNRDCYRKHLFLMQF